MPQQVTTYFSAFRGCLLSFAAGSFGPGEHRADLPQRKGRPSPVDRRLELTVIKPLEYSKTVADPYTACWDAELMCLEWKSSLFAHRVYPQI